MANVDCTSCAELREAAPDYAVNGVTTKVCNYLKNNTGLSGGSDNCTDLDIVNDCTIGMMDQVLDAYDTCDWKDFMHKYIPNDHQMNKAMLCAMCGMQTAIEQLNCYVNFLMNGVSFRIGEDTSGDAYAVAGKGISFLIPSSGWATSDLSLTYIAGGLVRGTGSYRFFNTDFTDEAECMNFDTVDSNYEPTMSKNRQGNAIWGQVGRPASGGELICEFRLKKSAFPQLKNLYAGFGQEQGGGAYHVHAMVINEGSYAYGQHGYCNEDGTPAADGFDHGHLVPSGWLYVQLRLTYCMQMGINQTSGSQYTPGYFMGIRLNQSGIDC